MALQLVQHWPIITTILGGVLAFGSLKTDVATLKNDQISARQDHDLIVRIDAGDQARDKRLDEMHDDIKELLTRAAPAPAPTVASTKGNPGRR